jgi:hypothetical protein
MEIITSTNNYLKNIFVMFPKVGLALSMVTLAYEVWQQKREEKNKVEMEKALEVDEGVTKGGQVLVIGSKHIPLDGKGGLYGMGDQYGGLTTISGIK